MEMTRTGGATKWPLLQPLVMLLSFPLAAFDIRWLPSTWVDYGYVMMTRLGICFSVVVLLWSWGFTRALFHWRSPVFIAASVISANAAYASYKFIPDKFSILAIIITGAILLALSQKLILDYSWVQMVAASIAAPGFFYFVLLCGGLLLKGTGRSIESYWPYFWQVGYLLGMFVIPDLFRKNPASSSVNL